MGQQWAASGAGGCGWGSGGAAVGYRWSRRWAWGSSELQVELKVGQRWSSSELQVELEVGQQ